ncbi:sugar ABC transporter ATP-binding protein [Treponema parvum]|uniref:Sugar ABC transporter ATP-binding protein n=2 Tax=Treponema parvum TaxID=138851 RepID=A0A975ID96_9SPIR|nr:sugar ABC transporter ATP-binding protein [Treponema parvum]QTQ17455.1 sugar ABC transporter ATP-binding protein [Treponema parvum]
MPGEVHALMGENGAGKSTLMKIIMGIYTKDAGKVLINGKEVEFRDPKEALNAGISMIHQELTPIPEMTVAENIFLGREKQKIKGLPFVDRKAMNLSTQELLDRYEVSKYIKPSVKMNNLNIAQVQVVEIIKAVSYNSKIIIMDEPTSSLSENESEVLFKIIANLKTQQVGIIYISHRMEEVFEIADRISVLRDGKFIGCVDAKGASTKELINMMVGRELGSGYPHNTAKRGKKVLEVKDFTRDGVFNGVDFSVHAGEILGFAGLVGAGRSEVMRAIVGYDKLTSGQIFLDGEEIHINNPHEAIKHHVIMVPEDRKLLGLVSGRCIRENIALQNLSEVSSGCFIRKYLEKKKCNKFADEVTVKMNGIEDEIGSLSGGNQQKVVLAKSLMSKPKVLIMDEPTRGIDVGAKATIYNIMVDLAKRGIAIIMISSELPELIGVADRILVMSGGKIMGELTDRKDFSQQTILSMAFGEAH